jgi:hypothetical protein
MKPKRESGEHPGHYWRGSFVLFSKARPRLSAQRTHTEI